ncbi:DNA polymerase delta subunit 3 [Periophthalmus magnuspinnatus]|uniref:DNA polymerase delta subunit 3 n=1 Tax=Periophthalmus magnuspinnatus TaxID=409849 RepID=UPI002436E0D1|nr:DNA polymerase delta subunit 3 [Periophthalmus magnuspinnatus]
MDTLYLDNIDEYVHDQDKIVTYKWLSLTLGVHVNTAKRMLFHYLEHKRKESSASLHATYLLSGKSVDHGQTCHKVSVVREEELEDAKSKLSAVVSVHVYSVHKALLRDSSPLFGVDYDAIKSNLQQCNRYSAICCPDAVPLSNAELHQSRESQQPPPPAAEIPKPQTNGSNLSAKTCPKPKGILGMFANKPKTESKSETKTETRPETKPETTVEPVAEPKPAPKANPVANFFGSQTAKKPVVVVKEESSSTEQRPTEANRDPRSKSKRVEESDREEEPKEKRKRRRIKRPQDSSDEEQDVIPDSPVQTKVQLSPDPIREEPAPQPETSSTKTRKRRRVLKSKTFEDEEGCIVTEKGYVSESYSETEEEVQTKPGPNPGPKLGSKPVKAQTEEKRKKGSSSAKTTKQASIMGFFNKK